MLPRGIRNNNPLNIRRSKDKWKGMAAQQNDAAFCQFESMEWGWRAAFYLLTRTYYHKHRLYTIRAIVSKWAPPPSITSRCSVAGPYAATKYNKKPRQLARLLCLELC